MAEILIIDPTGAAAGELAERFRLDGHHVVVERRVDEALARAAERPPALALLAGPAGDDAGMAFLAAADRMPALADMPVLPVTGDFARAAAVRTQRLVQRLLERNGQLERAARRDALTSLYNRYSLEETFGHEALVAVRYGTPFSIVMADVDRFKSINDTYGHPIGDLVLCAVADCFKERVRESDVLGRWGGEEFMVILPHTELDGATILAERLRSALHEESVAHRGDRIRFTASFGAAAFAGGDPFEVIDQADQALYTAKRGGRDRVASLGAELRLTRACPVSSPV